MEKEQQQYRKIKLYIKQPPVKCVGRKEVKCHYRGKVIAETGIGMLILIKSYGEDVLLTYNKEEDRFMDLGWEDLRIKE